jgi:hypothetical protein
MNTLESLLSAGALADDPTNTTDAWLAYADWSASLGGQDYDLDETPTPARAFKSGDTRPWELPAADCPVCGARLEDGAPICTRCADSSLEYEGDCLACSDGPARAESGLCFPCERQLIDDEDRARTAGVERQQKEMYQ